MHPRSGPSCSGRLQFPTMAGHFHSKRVARSRMCVRAGKESLLGGKRPRWKFSDEFKRNAVEIVRQSGKRLFGNDWAVGVHLGSWNPPEAKESPSNPTVGKDIRIRRTPAETDPTN